MHNDIWYQVPGLPGPWIYANTSFRFWNTNCSSSQNTFINSIYPLLKTVKSRGIDVICVLGDAGIQDKKGANMLSDDGIHFLASGINNSTLLPDTVAFENAPKDKVLIFEHQPKIKQLEWKFHDLDSLYAQ